MAAVLTFASLAAAYSLDACASESLGPDSSACREAANQPAVLVDVNGFKKREGDLRVQIYGPKAGAFLAKGKWVRRVDLPVTARGPMPVCVSLRAPGRYAVAVRNDVDGNGKSGWNDGGGFSRNPSISLFHLKPDFDKVVIPVGSGVVRVPVTLNYRRGLSIGPIT